MAFDEDLAARIREHLTRTAGVAERKMFGGIGFLLHGNMRVGVWKDALIARVGPDAYDDAKLEPHVGEFDITGRPMRGWVLVATEAIATKKDLQRWLDLGLSFAASLPAK